MTIFGFLDSNVLPFFLVVNAFGILYKGWIPKHEWARKIKECIPIPVVVTLLSVILCGIVGFLTGMAEGAEYIPLEVFKYVVGNGISLALISMAVYDTAYSIKKIANTRHSEKEASNEKAE